MPINNVLIERPNYLKKLIAYTDKGFIKVITGVRRCGKSSILTMFSNTLKESGKEILRLNIDTPEFLNVRDAVTLSETLQSRLTPETKYILLDEVQIVPGWERVVSAYYATGDYDITITGSNAYMLSSDLATHLTGRYIEIKVLPLSYKEFLTFKGTDSSEALFEEYVKFGGFPKVALTEYPEQKTEILESIRDSILYNDVVKRYSGMLPELLEKLVYVLNDSIGYPVVISKLLNTMKSAGYKVYHDNLVNYIQALKDAFMFMPVSFCMLKGRERFGIQDKYYSIDSGFANLGKSYGSENYGSILENIVFLELRRRGYKVSVGRESLKSLEVDFIAEKNGETQYIQVTETLLDPNTRNREFRSLEAIQDNWPKVIISSDIRDFSSDGIKCINIIDFLLS